MVYSGSTAELSSTYQCLEYFLVAKSSVNLAYWQTVLASWAQDIESFKECIKIFETIENPSSFTKLHNNNFNNT